MKKKNGKFLGVEHVHFLQRERDAIRKLFGEDYEDFADDEFLSKEKVANAFHECSASMKKREVTYSIKRVCAFFGKSKDKNGNISYNCFVRGTGIVHAKGHRKYNDYEGEIFCDYIYDEDFYTCIHEAEAAYSMLVRVFG
jgi:hypothetical protein